MKIKEQQEHGTARKYFQNKFFLVDVLICTAISLEITTTMNKLPQSQSNECYSGNEDSIELLKNKHTYQC